MTDNESDFDFEVEDDCDDFGSRNGDDDSNGDLLDIENKFYEAEDLISKELPLATTKFVSLLESLNQLLEETLYPANSVLLIWRSKIIRSMLRSTCGPEWCVANLQRLTEMLRFCVSDLKTTNSTETYSGLICSCLDCIAAAAPLEAAIETHGAVRAELWEANLKRASRQVFLKEARLLLEVPETRRLEKLLHQAYWEWIKLYRPNPGVHLTSALVSTLETVPHSDLADVLELIAIDVQHKRLESAERLDRLSRIMPLCSRVNRVLLDKKISITLYTAYGQSLCELGYYDKAYVAFYSGWDAAYSLGSLSDARPLLLNLTACNILSQSEIDPLSSREAQALLACPDEPDFLQVADWLANVSRAARQNECGVLKCLLKEGDFLRSGIFKGGDAEEELMYSVRCDRLASSEDRSRDALMKELAFDTEGEVLLFLSHGTCEAAKADRRSNEEEVCFSTVALCRHLLEGLAMDTSTLLTQNLRT